MTIVGLGELAARPGMPSEWKLRRLILRHPDFPMRKRGGTGRRYEIDVDAAEAFLRALTARPSSPEHRAQLAREIGLTLVNTQEGD